MLSYDIDTERGLVLTSESGVFTLDGVLDCHARLKADPRFRPDFCSLVDLTRMTEFAMTPEDICRLAKVHSGSPFRVTSRRAIIAPNAYAFGMLRMLALNREVNSGHETLRVFYDREKALRWLFPLPEPPAPGRRNATT